MLWMKSGCSGWPIVRMLDCRLWLAARARDQVSGTPGARRIPGNNRCRLRQPVLRSPHLHYTSLPALAQNSLVHLRSPWNTLVPAHAQAGAGTGMLCWRWRPACPRESEVAAILALLTHRSLPGPSSSVQTPMMSVCHNCGGDTASWGQKGLPARDACGTMRHQTEQVGAHGSSVSCVLLLTRSAHMDCKESATLVSA